MSKHTKEPWCVEACVSNDELDICLAYQIPGRESPILVASVYGDDPESVSEGMANARRIVACVNALAGIDTESLEQGEVNVMITKKAK